MRNVTIVESNIEPNKEHLWFYRGELKWFGPNGWETVTTSDITPKYIFEKTAHNLESIELTLDGSSAIVGILSYTQLNGVKTDVPVSISFLSGGTVAASDNIYHTNGTGLYEVSIYSKSVGYDIAFIKGAEGRSIIIPITVGNTSNTTTTTSTLYPVINKNIIIKNISDTQYIVKSGENSTGQLEQNETATLYVTDTLVVDTLGGPLKVYGYMYQGEVLVGKLPNIDNKIIGLAPLLSHPEVDTIAISYNEL